MSKTAPQPGRINILNRDRAKLFIPSPVEEYKIKTRIKSVRFVRRSPDDDYAELKRNNAQIDITNPEIYEGNRKPIDGIFSAKFGADATQDTPIYTCDCHKTTGGAKRGHICPYCGTEVRTIETDLRITGHIDIAPYHVLTFHGYTAFCDLFGTKQLNDIITTVRRISKSGKVIKDGSPTIMDLYDNYEEDYMSKIGLDKKYVFMSKIPVYSARLRPLMQQNYSIQMLEPNKRYMSITRLAGNLRSSRYMANVRRDVEIQRTLNQIQLELCRNDNKSPGIWQIVSKQIKGKEGVFRHALTSGRLDYSSRLVITLGQDLMAHEVDVPYSMMMCMYEEEIANYYSRLHDVSIAKAISKVEENAVYPHPEFIKIINLLLKNKTNRPRILVNRNPTINHAGIILMDIRKIHDDPKDMTLKLPVDVLTELGADFDGDQVTALAVKNPKYLKYFETMNPTYDFIDRSDGKYNAFGKSFAKDYAAVLSFAWDIDTAITNYLNNPDAESVDLMKQLGLDAFDNTEVARRFEQMVGSDKGLWKESHHDPFAIWADKVGK